jgi:hypothetical protein
MIVWGGRIRQGAARVVAVEVTMNSFTTLPCCYSISDHGLISWRRLVV